MGGSPTTCIATPERTGDIDFIVSPNDANQEKLRTVLREFGFGSVLPEASQPLVDGEKVLMLGRAPFRIDLLCQIDGVTFEEVEEFCRHFQIEGLRVPVISPELLLKNKQSTGRNKDMVDAEELQKSLALDSEERDAQ